MAVATWNCCRLGEFCVYQTIMYHVTSCKACLSVSLFVSLRVCLDLSFPIRSHSRPLHISLICFKHESDQFEPSGILLAKSGSTPKITENLLIYHLLGESLHRETSPLFRSWQMQLFADYAYYLEEKSLEHIFYFIFYIFFYGYRNMRCEGE